MRVLLDTHAVLWALADSEDLSARVRSLILEPANEVLVSFVSAWEIEIKRALGKLRAPGDIESAIVDAGFQTVSLHWSTLSRLKSLPQLHGDPFDRMLVAQAIESGAVFATCDRRLHEYPIATVW